MCKKLKQNIIGPNWFIIPSTEEKREEIRKTQRSKYSDEKECVYCHEKFDYGYSSLKSCLACKIIIKCSICGKEFELNLKNYSGTDQKRISEAILNNKPLILFCSKDCKIKAQSKSIKNFHKNNPSLMKNVIKNSMNIKYCEICGKETQHRGNDCTVCHGKNAVQKMIQYGKDNPEEEKKHRQNCAKSLNNWWFERPEERKQNAINNITVWNDSEEGKEFAVNHCSKLGKEFQTFNTYRDCNKNCRYFDNCNLKNDNILKNIYGYCSYGANGRPNFIVKNDVKFYKDKELNQFCEDLLSGKENINNYPGFEIRFGRVTYNRIDVLTSKKILYSNSNFTIQNGIQYILYDRKYIPLSNYFEIVRNQNRFININEFICKLREIYPQAFLQETFRTQDSDSWGAIKEIFDNKLKEKGVQWFAYIKFYIKGDNINSYYPLVGGKSGTKGSKYRNEKANGIEIYEKIEFNDIIFSYDISHGPSRLFLSKNNYDWLKTHVAIIPAKSEKDAYEIERNINYIFNLFNS